MSKFCQNCGTELSENSGICPQCGALTNQPVQQPVEQTYPTNNFVKEPGKGVSIAGMVLGIIAAIWACLSLLSSSSIRSALSELEYGPELTYGAVVTAFAIGYTLFSFIPSLIGLPLSISGFIKHKSGKNIAGLALNVFALVVSIVLFIYIKSVA